MQYNRLLDHKSPLNVQDLPDFRNEGQELNSEEIKQVINKVQCLAVMGIFKGDEGKGLEALTFALEKDFEYIFALVGGPNAGHTGKLPGGRKFVGHNLPGSALTGKPIFMGQGKYINIKGKLKELQELKELGIEQKLMIAYNANCIFDTFHGRMDGSIEDMKAKNGNEVGSTKAGMGPVVASRAIRSNITMGGLMSEYKTHSDLKAHVEEMVKPWNNEMFGSVDEIVVEIKEHQKILQELIDNDTVEIVDDNFGSDLYLDGANILIEGAQSDPLGMFGGAYPNNTSTDTRSAGMLSSLNVMPEPGRYGEIIVGKLLSTAVGKHIFEERISHMFPDMLEEEKKLAEEIFEYGATTERLRMLGFATPLAFAEYIKRNPYVIAASMRKCDILPQFDKHVGHKFGNQLPIITGKDQEGNLDVKLSSYEPQEIITTFRDTINEIAGAGKGDLPIITGVGSMSGKDDSRIHRI